MQLLQPSIEHVEEIAAIHIKSWQAAYAHILPGAFLATMSVADRANRWAKILAAQESTTIIAKSDTGELAGFVSYGKCRDEGAPQDQGEIWALYASPSFWGQGFGRELFSYALNSLRAAGYSKVSLWVLTENHRGIRFYKAAGFTELEGSAKKFELGGSIVEEVCLVQGKVA